MSRTLILTAAAATAACTAAVVMAGPATAATADTGASSTASSCDRAPWSTTVQGRPAAYKSGAPAGDYLWHDSLGFHLRVTHAKDDRRVFTGEITSSAPMRLEPVKLEKGDVVRLSASHRSFVFSFVNYGHIDGVDFHTDCAGELKVADLNLGNGALPARDVYLGAKDTHPSRVPFIVHRTSTSLS